MINAKRVLAKDEGSCNYCDRQISMTGTDPRAVVTLITGDRGASIRLCDQCLKDMLVAVRSSRGQKAI